MASRHMAFVTRFHLVRQGLILGCCVAGATLVRAETVVTGSLQTSSSGTVPGGLGISVVGYILTIFLLIAAAAMVLVRNGFFGVLRGGGKVEKKLHIEETRSLGHRQYLVVAEYEGRRFLLGVCPGRIDYLSGLEREHPSNMSSDADKLPKSFSEHMQMSAASADSDNLTQAK